MAVKEEHQRKTQPNYERRLREEERKEAHERWRKDLEVRVVLFRGGRWTDVGVGLFKGCAVCGPCCLVVRC